MRRGARRVQAGVALAVLLAALSGSCQGCPNDPDTFLGHDFGTLNPLFDRAGFVDFTGKVVDPSTAVPKRFRVEMILPVEPSSVPDTSIRAFVLAEGQMGDVINPPPAIDDPPGDPIPPPPPIDLIPVRVTSLDHEVNALGLTVALTATLDPEDVADHPGRELIVQLDPRGWTVPGAPSDGVLQTPTRFTYRISESGPDGEPPFLSDVLGLATAPLRGLLEREGRPDRTVPIVPPHAALTFVFSEPLAVVTPLMDPQDPVGLRPMAGTRAGGGILDVVTQTQAGLVPGEDYCLSFVPPDLTNLGPLSWGTQDLSGEPLVPPVAPAGGTGSPEQVDATDLCFRTGPVRIEAPRRDTLLPVGPDPLTLSLIAANGPASEPGVVYRVMARLDDGSSFDGLPLDWQHVGDFDETSPGIEVVRDKALRQGEVLKPVDLVTIPVGAEALDLTIDLCALADEDECLVMLRVDRCIVELAACELGDVVNVRFDMSVPSLPEKVCEPGGSTEGCTEILDSDPRDCTIDRICVPGDMLEYVRVSLCGQQVIAPVEARLRPGGDGDYWYCAEGVTAPDAGSPEDTVAVVAVTRAGYRSDVGMYRVPLFLPPYKLVVRPPPYAVTHFRQPFAQPVVVRGDAQAMDGETALTLSRWNGVNDWNDETITWDDQPGIRFGTVYRGRMDSALLPDGSVVFCATRRPYIPNSIWGPDDAQPDLDFRGDLELVQVRGPGDVTVVRPTFARALGCALDVSPDGRHVAVGYVAPKVTSAPTDLPGRPAMLLCDVGPEGISLSGCRAAADLAHLPDVPGGFEALGLDPDVAYSDGRIQLVGRGIVGPDDGLFEEYTVYRLETTLDGTLAGGEILVQQELDELAIAIDEGGRSCRAFGFDLWAGINVWGAVDPRIIPRTVTTPLTILYRKVPWLRWPNVEPCDSRLGVTFVEAVAFNPFRPGDRRVSAVTPRVSMRGPLRSLMPLGAFDLRRVRNPEPPPPLDVRGDRLTVAQRPAGKMERLQQIEGEDVLTDVSRPEASWLPPAIHTMRVSATLSPYHRSVSPVEVIGTPETVDVEMGSGPDTDRLLSTWVGPLGDVSVAYDQNVKDITSGLLYVEERTGQFVNVPGGEPRAVDGWTNLMHRSVLTSIQSSLLADGQMGRWSTVRAPRTEAVDVNENPHGDLTCALNNQADLALASDPMDGAVNDVMFTADVRRPILAPLVGFATSLRTATARGRGGEGLPAVMVGQRILTSTRFPAGATLELRMSGSPTTVALPRAAVDVGDLRELLDSELRRATGRSQPHADVYNVAPDPGGQPRARLVLLSWGPDATLEVRGGTLAGELGFPLGEPATASVIDAANGDSDDRFRSCTAPCVEGPDGNCDRPVDCLDPDVPLLSSAVQDVRMQSGRPPLRVQANVCVPRHQLELGRSTDACGAVPDPSDVPEAMQYRAGTPGSFPSRLVRVYVPGLAGFDVPCNEDIGELPFPAVVEIFGAPVNVDYCLACGPLRDLASPNEELPAQVRRCSTDDDCTLHRSCHHGSCDPSPSDYYCTHLTIPYMGVPAGGGLCARPIPCTEGEEGCEERFVNDDDAEHAFSRTIRVQTLPHARNPADGDFGDFEPSLPSLDESPLSGAECMLTGCQQCLGAEPNGYCHADADCPADHVCLTPDRSDRGPRDGTPACLLRPVLADGRLQEALTRVGDLRPDDPQYDELRATVEPLTGLIDRIGGILGELSLPVRTFEHTTGRRGRERDIIVFDVRTPRLSGLTVDWEPPESGLSPAALPGSGDFVVRLSFHSGRIVVHGRVKGDIVDNDFTADADPGELSFTLRPVLHHLGGGGALLRLRQVATDFHVGRVRLTEGFSEVGLLDLIGFVLDKIIVRLFLLVHQPPVHPEEALGEVEGVDDALAPVLQSLADDVAFGGLLFGVPESSVSLLGGANPRLEAAAGASGVLDLRYRGFRAATAAVVMQLSQPPDRFCCALCTPDGQPEPSADCLEEPGVTAEECIARCPAAGCP